MYDNIKVTYITIDTLNDTIAYLAKIPSLAAFDFEAANKYTKEEISILQQEYETTEDKFKRIELNQKINANGLSHPSLTIITHLSVAWSNNNALVFVTLDDKIRKAVYEYLIETTTLQLWHKALFDFRHIHYHTNKFPKSYFDVQLYIKSLINNANNMHSRTSLKHLMANKYGKWAERRDSSFTIEDAYNQDMLEYAATDACALYECYQDYVIKSQFSI